MSWITPDCVVAELPRAGLANRLFVWAKAHVFARQHSLPLFVHGWGHLHIGPILRRENSYRFYAPSFGYRTNYSGLVFRAVLGFMGKQTVFRESDNKGALTLRPGSGCYIFDEVPRWDDYFADLRGYEAVVRAGLMEMIRPKLRQLAGRFQDPCIALHIRRGDFRAANRELTENSYFVKAVNSIREAAGEALPVTIFSDGSDDELDEVLSLPNVSRHESSSDVADLLVMSRAMIIVTSLHSTFGYWSGFLSNAAVVLDPRHGASRIRSQRLGLFEGTLEECCKDISDNQISLASHAPSSSSVGSLS